MRLRGTLPLCPYDARDLARQYLCNCEVPAEKSRCIAIGCKSPDRISFLSIKYRVNAEQKLGPNDDEEALCLLIRERVAVTTVNVCLLFSIRWAFPSSSRAELGCCLHLQLKWCREFGEQNGVGR
jgi:hypothetical protein